MSKYVVAVHRFARNVKGLGDVTEEEHNLAWTKTVSRLQGRRYLVSQSIVGYRRDRGVLTPKASRRPLDPDLTWVGRSQ